MNDFSIWDPIEFTTERCATWTLECLSLWIEHYEHEWHVLPMYNKAGLYPESRLTMKEKDEKPQSSDWVHYIIHDGNWILPVPAMMDRPVVVRPDRQLVLIPGERANFFLSLPLSFRLMVSLGSKTKTLRKLAEFPICTMKNTWFGDPVSGELCYFNNARLFADFNQIPVSSIQAVCPIMISNESERELSFDRICLHTEFLGIYRSPSRFWTNEVRVVFKGTEQETQIQPSKNAPLMEGPMNLVTDPRQPIENWHLKRTFNLLKQFSGF